MPLILITGYPSSGKSTVADSLVAKIKNDHPTAPIVLIRDQDLATFNKDIYRDSSKEKEHRGYLRSLVQKSLTDQTVLIVDSLNYIKGYRYELYCIAKQVKTTYCVILCDVNPETAHHLNNTKDDRYPPDILDALIQRYESPDSRHRWDNPLFTIHPTAQEPSFPNLDAILQEIVDCILRGKPLKANQSTQSQPLSSTNFLYELDSLTQEIVKSLMELQKTAVPGDTLKVSGTDEKVILKKAWSLSEMSRLRRQFIAYAKMHPIDDRNKLATMFVTFINNS